MTVLSFASRALPLASSAPFAIEALTSSPESQDMPTVSRIGQAKDLPQARLLLNEAERVIQSQEERIRQLESLALTDELTGLLNRRGLMAALRRELAASRRTSKSAGLLIMIDVDDFKMVNDLYGHAVGDAYLQTVGSVLINEVRTSDYVARLGGDEFVVLLPQINLKAAGARLDKLERTLNGRVMHRNQHSIPLSASFGFAVLSETETPETLLATADSKLYANKARRKMGSR